MATRTIDRRRRSLRAPSYRTTGSDELALRRAGALGLGLDFKRERQLVDRWLDAELEHVERAVPAPRQSFIEYRPGFWEARRWLVLLAVIAIVLVFWALPRATVTSAWDGRQVTVGQSFAATPAPYDGPKAIGGEAAPSGISGDAVAQP